MITIPGRVKCSRCGATANIDIELNYDGGLKLSNTEIPALEPKLPDGWTMEDKQWDEGRDYLCPKKEHR